MTTLTDERLAEIRARDAENGSDKAPWWGMLAPAHHDRRALLKHIDALEALRGREGGGKREDKHAALRDRLHRVSAYLAADADYADYEKHNQPIHDAIEALYPASPAPQVAESRSVQRRVAAQKGEPAPVFCKCGGAVNCTCSGTLQPVAESQGARLSSAPWKVVSGKENGKGWPVCTLGVDHNDVFWYIETDGVHASEAVSEPENDARAIVAWRNALAGSVR